MNYKIGDKVIHTSFGFAEIIGIENKVVSGMSQKYYVAKTKEMEIWVPISENDHPSKIRLPSSIFEFQDCFKILKSKYTPLSPDRNIRKTSINSKNNIGTINASCELIRDLSNYKIQNKINDNEKTILEKAILVLLDEWGFVFNIPSSQARSELNKLLNESYANSI
jgi:RNA polymerase-interacting CarD/CdnL/TRCF family regulator